MRGVLAQIVFDVDVAVCSHFPLVFSIFEIELFWVGTVGVFTGREWKFPDVFGFRPGEDFPVIFEDDEGIRILLRKDGLHEWQNDIAND